MDQQTAPPPTSSEIAQYHQWWNHLSTPWKTAFNEIMLRRTSESMPDDDTLHLIHTAPALRFAGPDAPYPNMSFELDDLSGVLQLKQLEIFVFTFQNIRSIAAIAQLPQLKSLFVFNNHISSLEGVESLTELSDLYFNANEVESLLPLQHLTQLKTVYCNHNRLRSLEGIGPQHADNLRQFFCMPNEGLTDAATLRFEREVGIRCLKG